MTYKSILRSAYHVIVKSGHFCTSNSWLKTSVPFSFLSCCPLIIPLLSLLAFKDFQPFMDGSSPSIRFRELLKWYYDKQKVFLLRLVLPYPLYSHVLSVHFQPSSKPGWMMFASMGLQYSQSVLDNFGFGDGENKAYRFRWYHLLIKQIQLILDNQIRGLDGSLSLSLVV